MDLEVIKSKISPFYWSILKDTDLRLDIELCLTHNPPKIALNAYLDNLFYIYHSQK